jgi:hypothetical protein
MSRGYKVLPSQSTKPKAPPSDWQMGLCDCCGKNQCCVECCCVALGLDYCLYKDVDEWYIGRQQGVKYDNTRKYVPVYALEKLFGVTCYRATCVLCTCGLVAATGGVFDLLWCCVLARQRRQVRDMYRIDGNPCSDCFLACCCRCCMFNQLKHQFEADPDTLDWNQPEQVNSMRG